MKVIIAIDSFKGSMDSIEAGEAAAVLPVAWVLLFTLFFAGSWSLA